jgi:hypothetical protein
MKNKELQEDVKEMRKDKIFSIKKELKEVKYVKKQNWKLYYFGFYLSLFAMMDS